MTKYDELIAEAEEFADVHATGHAAILLMRAAAALRECAPPPGWCWTELSRGDRDLTNARRGQEGDPWYLVREDGGVTKGKFATAQEAIAAYEADKQT